MPVHDEPGLASGFGWLLAGKSAAMHECRVLAMTERRNRCGPLLMIHDWYLALADLSAGLVRDAIEFLSERGPASGRPAADRITGSRQGQFKITFRDLVTLGSHKLERPDRSRQNPFRGFLDGVHVFHAE